MLSSLDAGSWQSSLSFITDTLLSVPVQNLPFVIPHLAPTLASCKNVFSVCGSHGQEKANSGLDILTHKYKTQITSLLNGKDIGGRWAAVVLIKMTIEAGPAVLLPEIKQWSRGLLGILARTDPPTTKATCIVTLSRIFLLSRSDPTLVRELSTPTLPSFITSCLNLVTTEGKGLWDGAEASISEAVLCSFCELLPQFPNTFRPFAGRIHKLLLLLLAPTLSSIDDRKKTPATPNSGAALSHLCQKARRLFIRLHFTASKNALSDEWIAAYRAVAAEFTETATQVFQYVSEGMEQDNVPWSSGAAPGRVQGQANLTSGPSMGLPDWTGVTAGVERMTGLLGLLGQFFAEVTASTVVLPIGAITEVLARALSVVASSNGELHAAWEGSDRLGANMDKGDRQTLWAGLLGIHVAAMEVLSVMMDRLKYDFLPLAHGTLQQVIYVFEAEHWSIHIRSLSYLVVAKILKLAGPSMAKSTVLSLSRLIRQACDDIPFDAADVNGAVHLSSSGPGRGSQAHAKTRANLDAFPKGLPAAGSNSTMSNANELDAFQTAWDLLPVCLNYLSSRHLEHSLRAKIDRTAILARHKSAMIASVLHPPGKTKERRPLSSIMPHLARAFQDDPEVEGLIRPRMPVLLTPSVGEGTLDMERLSVEPEAVQESRPAHVTHPQSNIGRRPNGSEDIEEAYPDAVGEASQRPRLPSGEFDKALSGSRTAAGNKHQLETHANALTETKEFQPGTSDPVPAPAFAANQKSLEENAVSDSSHVSKRPRLESPHGIADKPTLPEHREPVLSQDAHPVSDTTDVAAQQQLAPAIKSAHLEITKQDEDDDASDDDFVIPPIVLDSDSEHDTEADHDGQF